MTPRQSQAITERRQALRNAGNPYGRADAAKAAHRKPRKLSRYFEDVVILIAILITGLVWLVV